MILTHKCKFCKQSVEQIWDENGDRWKLIDHLNIFKQKCQGSGNSIVPGGGQTA